MKYRLIAAVCSFLLIISFSFSSFAGFGDFAGDSDYGYDDYDYGGYDYDNDNDYDYDYDDDRDNNYYYYDNNKEEKTTSYYSLISGSHSDDDNYGGYYDSKGKPVSVCSLKNTLSQDGETDDATAGAILIGIILIIVVCCVRKKRKKIKPVYRPANVNFSRPVAPGPERTDASTLTPMAKYKEIDPAFDENELKSKITNLYVRMQNCWQNKNIESLRPYFTDTLYTRFDMQLDSYRKKKETNYVERIAVLGVEPVGWKTAAGEDSIVVIVRARVVDYVLSDETGALVRGSRTDEKFMTYEWTLSRKSGVKTGETSGTRVVTCPQCGAPIDINRSAKCEYCGSVVTVDSFDWAISEMKGLSQRTRR